MLDRAWGIARSLAMYHGIPGRHRRMVRFYGQFLGPGDLGFDIGAHVGGRVRAWRRLGARVLAVEPQPDCLRVLRLLYGRDRAFRFCRNRGGGMPGGPPRAWPRPRRTAPRSPATWMTSA